MKQPLNYFGYAFNNPEEEYNPKYIKSWLSNMEIPYKVVLDESIELAKHFGGADSHKYINGVLDRVATQLRPDEKQL